MNGWDVTYEIISDESAERGDVEEWGFLGEDLSLRQAIAELFFDSPQAEVSSVEAGAHPYGWLTVHWDRAWDDGTFTSRSLHPPEGITASSWRRVCRLLSP